jgi:hypothetical protein
MANLALQSAREYPDTNTNLGTSVVMLRDQLVGDLTMTLWIEAAGVVCVLLIMCANLAGLLLTRGVGREREFAVRAALGAGRLRLIRQTLIESFLLAGVGGAGGVLIAAGALPFLRQAVPTALHAWSAPHIDLRLLAFLLLLSIVTAILFGALPALLASRPNLGMSLQQGGTSPFTVEGAPPLSRGESNDANHRVVSPGYFKTMGVALRIGRFFRDADAPNAPPVAIINQAMARQFWPGRDPLQRRFELGRVPGVWFTVVGVVDDIRQTGLDVAGRAEMYFPYTQPEGT